MNRSDNLHQGLRPRESVASAREKISSFFREPPARWLLVDVAGQRLTLFSGTTESRSWPVSTARAGIDATEGSGGTPPGLHVVREKIGSGTEPGTIFRSRQPTGEVWRDHLDPPAARAGDEAGDETDDLILSRILTLDGLEEGANRGSGCDSLARYIYIHGTNDEHRLGQPVSHGCIRLSNAAVIELFELVAEGDPVVIV